MHIFLWSQGSISDIGPAAGSVGHFPQGSGLSPVVCGLINLFLLMSLSLIFFHFIMFSVLTVVLFILRRNNQLIEEVIYNWLGERNTDVLTREWQRMVHFGPQVGVLSVMRMGLLIYFSCDTKDVNI